MASKTQGLLIGGGVAVLALILSKRVLARTAVSSKRTSTVRPTLPSTPTPDVALGKHFKLSEFLKSKTFPKQTHYRPTVSEMNALRRLVGLVLEPLREKFGPIVITGGARSKTVAAAYGTTWYDALKKQGLDPAKKSDHAWFGAADVRPTKLTTVAQWQKFVQAVESNPNVRQALAYLKQNPDGTYKISMFHIAVSNASHPVLNKKIIWRLNGKTIATPTAFQNVA